MQKPPVKAGGFFSLAVGVADRGGGDQAGIGMGPVSFGTL